MEDVIRSAEAFHVFLSLPEIERVEEDYGCVMVRKEEENESWMLVIMHTDGIRMKYVILLAL